LPTNTLTDAKCKAAKADDKPRKIFDGGGLYLYVTPNGSKVWRLSYRVDKKPQTKTIGPYPDVSLAAAREKRSEAKALLRDGEDPNEERRAKRKKKSITLSEANVQYWTGRKDISDSYRSNAMRGIELHLCPALGSRDLASIDRTDLLAELNRMDADGLHEYVRKVRMWVGQVFDWAIEQELAKINPAALIRPEKAFGKAKVEHYAAIDPSEVPDFMMRLSLERDLQSVIACRVLAHTWVRTTELRFMLKTEIDVKAAMWKIPAGKMKRARDHLVPLTRQTLALLEKQMQRSRSIYVFPQEFRHDRPMSENAVLYLIHRIGYKGRMTGHGWRTVASTWANEMGYNSDAIERQLSHVPEDATRAAYNRAEYLRERRKLMEAWSDWLEQCEQTGEQNAS
jgi:integrase